MEDLEKEVDVSLNNINLLYEVIDKVEDPRSICVKLLKYHKGHIEVSKLLYFVMINYDLTFPDFYEITCSNITKDTLPDNIYFIKQILYSDVTVCIIQRYIDCIVNILFEIDTPSLIKILEVLVCVYNKNKSLRKDYPHYRLLERSVSPVRELIKKI